MRPCQTILVLEDLRKSFEGPLYRKGVELSSSDRETVLDVYQQWLLLLLDLGYLHHETLERDAQRLLVDMTRMDVLDLNNAFTEFLRRIREQEIKGFKVLCKEISPHLFPMVKDDLELVSLGDVFAARRLVQLSSYTSRLTLNKIDLTQECLEDYRATENNISDYLPEVLLSNLNRIIKDWMKPFDPTLVVPGHSQGGVAGLGRTSLLRKYKDLTFDKRLTYAFGEPYWVTSPIRSTCDRISQTIFVPKNYKTFRTISMEPTTLQFCQQGVWKEIQRVVESDYFLRNHIGFEDQKRNQRLAQEGSIARNYATIDLSAASDSVSYALVKRLFRGTKLLRFLVATRSTRTFLPDRQLIELKKFAPMGSALCFPIETMIFASICHYVTREHYVTGQYSVYGDDIIVPTQCVEDTILILETLGFRVNRSKSFYSADCWFRESCGAEYCDGYDVTPMRVSRRFNNRQLLVQTSGLIDSANRAHQKGFRNLRRYFLAKFVSYSYDVRKKKGKDGRLHVVKDSNGKPVELHLIPLFSPSSLIADSYTNYHTERKWDHDFQRIECRVTDPITKYKGEDDESLRYLHWLQSTADRIAVGDGFQSEIRRPMVSIQSCWREKPYEDHDQSFIDYFTR